jgi:hypothetical protein
LKTATRWQSDWQYFATEISALGRIPEFQLETDCPSSIERRGKKTPIRTAGRLPTETHSNYGALLPWWDWLFGSFRWRHDTENIEIGLDAFADPKWQTLSGMARTPLEKPRPPKPHK